ncbi:unnamed protein product [Amoebophrya sp. A120]|nr:unnamed protein product [Amoebophrya sp. A120]|eukprot:GSA120T00010658001.1
MSFRQKQGSAGNRGRMDTYNSDSSPTSVATSGTLHSESQDSISNTTSSSSKPTQNQIPAKLAGFFKLLSKQNSKIDRLTRVVDLKENDNNAAKKKELLEEIESAKVLVAEASALFAQFQQAGDPAAMSLSEKELFKGQQRKLSASLAQLSKENERLTSIGMEKVAKLEREENLYPRLDSDDTIAVNLPVGSSTAPSSSSKGAVLSPRAAASSTTLMSTSTKGGGTAKGTSSASSSTSGNKRSPTDTTTVDGRQLYNGLNATSSNELLLQELESASKEANSQIRAEQRMIQGDSKQEFEHELIAERNQEISGIHRDMATIQSLYKELSTHVEEQGQSIIQMEETISSTVDHTSNAFTEIQQTERYLRKQTKVYTCLMVLTLICTLFLLYFFWDLLSRKLLLLFEEFESEFVGIGELSFLSRINDEASGDDASTVEWY